MVGPPASLGGPLIPSCPPAAGALCDAGVLSAVADAFLSATRPRDAEGREVDPHVPRRSPRPRTVAGSPRRTAGSAWAAPSHADRACSDGTGTGDEADAEFAGGGDDDVDGPAAPAVHDADEGLATASAAGGASSPQGAPPAGSRASLRPGSGSPEAECDAALAALRSPPLQGLMLAVCALLQGSRIMATEWSRRIMRPLLLLVHCGHAAVPVSELAPAGAVVAAILPAWEGVGRGWADGGEAAAGAPSLLAPVLAPLDASSCCSFGAPLADATLIATMAADTAACIAAASSRAARRAHILMRRHGKEWLELAAEAVAARAAAGGDGAAGVAPSDVANALRNEAQWTSQCAWEAARAFSGHRSRGRGGRSRSSATPSLSSSGSDSEGGEEGAGGLPVPMMRLPPHPAPQAGGEVGRGAATPSPVEDAAVGEAAATEAPADLSLLWHAALTVRHTLVNACASIRANHFDEEAVSAQFERLAALFRALPASRLLAALHPPCMPLVVRGLNNIDEGVMESACRATAALATACPTAQAALVRAGADYALVDCARDYNAGIRERAFAALGELVDNGSVARPLRARPLRHVVSAVLAFPAEDTTEEVFLSALRVAARATAGNALAQRAMLRAGGLHALARVIVLAAEALQWPQDAKAVHRGLRPGDGAFSYASAARHLSNGAGGSPLPSDRKGGSAAFRGGAAAAADAGEGGARRALSRPASARPRTTRPDRRAAEAAPAASPATHPRDKECARALAGRGSQVALSALEVACTALGNLVYDCRPAQVEARRSGYLSVALALVHGYSGMRGTAAASAAPPELATAAASWPIADAVASWLLHTVVNAVATDAEAQSHVGTRELCDVVQQLLGAASGPEGEGEGKEEDGSAGADGGDALRPVVGSSDRLASLSALLCSHVVWNHPQNQDLFSTKPLLRRLVACVRAGVLPALRDSAEEWLPIVAQLGPLWPQEAEAGAEAASPSLDLVQAALMALTNLCYRNPRAQEAVHALGATPHLLAWSLHQDLRTTALACLENLVAGQPEVAREFDRLGGVAWMVCLVTDDEETEEASKAFQVLEHLATPAAARLLSLASRVAAAIPLDTFAPHRILSRHSLRGSRRGDRDGTEGALAAEEERRTDAESLRALIALVEREGVQTPQGAPPCELPVGLRAPSASHSLAVLARVLAVLNGLAYARREARDALVGGDGGAACMALLCRRLPDDLGQQVALVLLNAMADRAPEVQRRALADGVVDVLAEAVVAKPALRAPLCAVLSSCALGCREAATAMAAQPHLVRAIAQTVVAAPLPESGDSEDASGGAEAADLLVTVAEACQVSGDTRLKRDAGVRHALEHTASPEADVSDAVRARAAQYLREA